MPSWLGKPWSQHREVLLPKTPFNPGHPGTVDPCTHTSHSTLWGWQAQCDPARAVSLLHPVGQAVQFHRVFVSLSTNGDICLSVYPPPRSLSGQNEQTWNVLHRAQAHRTIILGSDSRLVRARSSVQSSPGHRTNILLPLPFAPPFLVLPPWLPSTPQLCPSVSCCLIQGFVVLGLLQYIIHFLAGGAVLIRVNIWVLFTGLQSARIA